MGKENIKKGLSKKDKMLAVRFESVGGIFAENLPKPRIEGVAQKAADGLVELKSGLDKDYLNMSPNGDVLSDVYDNFQFLKNDIFPIVTRLMERTTVGVPIGKNSILGCRFISKNEGGEDKVELEIMEEDIVDYDEEGIVYNLKITCIADIQQFWDQGNIDMRKSLRKFSKMNKNKLLRTFAKYIDEYLNP